MTPIKILIVEDKVVQAERTAMQLRHHGYQVTDIARTGGEAIASLSTDLPDLILMDIHLEGKIDGIQTTKIINKIANLPVIYLTAFKDKATIQEAVQTKHANFFPKPVVVEKLIVAIEHALLTYAQQKTEANASFFKLNEAIFLHRKDRWEKVLLAHILWIKSGSSTVEIMTLSHKKYTVSVNLKQFLERCHHSDFLRVHRSYAINIKKVEAIVGRRLVIGEQLIPFSESYAEQVKACFRTIRTGK